MKTLIALSLLTLAAGYCLTHPMPVKGGTCIVFDGPNLMHCKGTFPSKDGRFTWTETWSIKVD